MDRIDTIKVSEHVKANVYYMDDYYGVTENPLEELDIDLDVLEPSLAHVMPVSGDFEDAMDRLVWRYGMKAVVRYLHIFHEELDVWALSVYRHGGSVYRATLLESADDMPGRGWDTAVTLMTTEGGTMTQAAMTSLMEYFTTWCNGEVYGYELVMDDDTEEEILEASWGYVGWRDLKDAVEMEATWAEGRALEVLEARAIEEEREARTVTVTVEFAADFVEERKAHNLGSKDDLKGLARILMSNGIYGHAEGSMADIVGLNNRALVNWHK